MARESWIQSLVESYQWLKKWYLMSPCLTLSIIRYGSRVNPGKGVAPSSTPWCRSYRKRSLWVTLDYGCQLYLFIYRYMCRTIVRSTWNFEFIILILNLLWHNIKHFSHLYFFYIYIYIYIYIHTHTHTR